MSDKIEINISSSALSHASCMLELYRTIVQGYKEPYPDASLIYGVAVHKYRDVMFKTKGHIPTARDEALKAFRIDKTDKPKSPHLSDERHMLTTAYLYWDNWISKDQQFQVLELGGTPAIELTFSIPYIENDMYIVNLAGTIDGLGKVVNGVHAIQDLKTTSSWDDKNYFKKYELSKQLRFYMLALKLMSERYPDSTLGRIGKEKVGCFIDALFIKPSPSDNKYIRSEVFMIENRDIEEFQGHLNSLINRILSSFLCPELLGRDGIITGACQKGYGKLCSFYNVCCQNDSRVAEALLRRDFVIKPFEPLHYND